MLRKRAPSGPVDMSDDTPRSFKITVRLQERRDGGLRVWSDDLPELVLSNRDRQKVWDDLEPALNHILSARLGCEVRVDRLEPLQAVLRSNTAPPRKSLLSALAGSRRDLEFAASACAA